MMNRRLFLMTLPGFLAACVSPGVINTNGRKTYPVDPFYRRIYGPVKGEPFPLPALDLRYINPVYLRREVSYTTRHVPGTIVIDLGKYFCYFILPGGKAMRYGVGVARNNAVDFLGRAVIGRKVSWPHWVPTTRMMKALPDLYGDLGAGLPPGPENPLGSRALYLYRDGKDTFFRLHGTAEPESIGTNVSSGCIRFFNHDIIDLYKRVSVGTRVVVLKR